MNRKWKVIIGLVCITAFLIAQQPVAQGPQAGNAAAWKVTGNGTAGSADANPVTVQGIASGVAVLVAGGGTAGSSGTAVLTVQGIASGTAIPISGSVAVTGTSNAVPQSTATYAGTAFDLAATAATQVKATAGNVWGWYGYNPNTSTCFLQFYNSASATLGTAALHPFGVLAGGSFNAMPGNFAAFNLSTAISTGQTTTATGATPCTSAMVITIIYN
jgi:hypothetical protein